MTTGWFARAMLIFAASLVTAPHALADKSEQTWRAYGKFVSGLIQRRDEATVEQIRGEHLVWLDRLLRTAQSEPDSPHHERILRESLGIANSFGTIDQVQIVVDRLVEQSDSSHDRARWRSELGEICVLRRHRDPEKHGKLGLATLKHAESDWNVALRSAANAERPKILGELALVCYWQGELCDSHSKAADHYHRAAGYVASDSRTTKESRICGLGSMQLPIITAAETESWLKAEDSEQADNAIRRLLALISEQDTAVYLHRIGTNVYGTGTAEYVSFIEQYASADTLSHNIPAAHEFAESLLIRKQYSDLFIFSDATLRNHRQELADQSLEANARREGGYLAAFLYFAGESAYQIGRADDAERSLQEFLETFGNDSRCRTIRGRLAELREQE